MVVYIGFIVVVIPSVNTIVVVLSLGCRCCRPSVNTICGRIIWVYCCLPSVGRIIIGLSLSSVSKHNNDWVVFVGPSLIRSCYDWVVVWVVSRCRIMIGLSLLSSVSKHNMWSYYDWVVLSSVSKHNMWSYYDWVVVVVFRQ